MVAVGRRHRRTPDGDGLMSARPVERCHEPLPPRHVVDTLAALGVPAMGFGWSIYELQPQRRRITACHRHVRTGRFGCRRRGLRSSTLRHRPPRSHSTNPFVFVCPHASSGSTCTAHPRRWQRCWFGGRPKTTVTDVTIADQSGAVLVSIAGMAFEELGELRPRLVGQGHEQNGASDRVVSVAGRPP